MDAPGKTITVTGLPIGILTLDMTPTRFTVHRVKLEVEKVLGIPHCQMAMFTASNQPAVDLQTMRDLFDGPTGMLRFAFDFHGVQRGVWSP